MADDKTISTNRKAFHLYTILETFEAGLVLPAYEATLVCSHQFNILDARGAVSTTDRVGIVRRIRDLACACARAYVSGREGSRFPLSEPEPAAV